MKTPKLTCEGLTSRQYIDQNQDWQGTSEGDGGKIKDLNCYLEININPRKEIQMDWEHSAKSSSIQNTFLDGYNWNWWCISE